MTMIVNDADYIAQRDYDRRVAESVFVARMTREPIADWEYADEYEDEWGYRADDQHIQIVGSQGVISDGVGSARSDEERLWWLHTPQYGTHIHHALTVLDWLRVQARVHIDCLDDHFVVSLLWEGKTIWASDPMLSRAICDAALDLAGRQKGRQR